MRRAAIVVATVLAASTGPALAQDVNFKIFGAAAYVSPLSEDDADIGTVRDSLEASSELGWSFGFEWRWSQLLGLEIDYINSTQDLDFGGTTIAEVDFQPVSASLNIHLISTTFIDVYVAPTASYIRWGDIEVTGSASDFNVTSDIESDPEFAWGAQAGLDIGFGESFAVTGAVRWLNADLSPDESGADELGVNPLISRVGIAFRF